MSKNSSLDNRFKILDSNIIKLFDKINKEFFNESLAFNLNDFNRDEELVKSLVAKNILIESKPIGYFHCESCYEDVYAKNNKYYCTSCSYSRTLDDFEKIEYLFKIDGFLNFFSSLLSLKAEKKSISEGLFRLGSRKVKYDNFHFYLFLRGKENSEISEQEIKLMSENYNLKNIFIISFSTKDLSLNKYNVIEIYDLLENYIIGYDDFEDYLFFKTIESRDKSNADNFSKRISLNKAEKYFVLLIEKKAIVHGQKEEIILHISEKYNLSKTQVEGIWQKNATSKLKKHGRKRV